MTDIVWTVNAGECFFKLHPIMFRQIPDQLDYINCIYTPFSWLYDFPYIITSTDVMLRRMLLWPLVKFETIFQFLFTGVGFNIFIL